MSCQTGGNNHQQSAKSEPSTETVTMLSFADPYLAMIYPIRTKAVPAGALRCWPGLQR